ncbi:hypothetical protein SAMN02910314_02016, partial [Denitrobacterium detoxificans]
MPTSIQEFPKEYVDAIDEVLAGATYATAYDVGAAEFVNGRQVSVPELSFGDSPNPANYNRFQSGEADVTLNRTTYTLANDKEKVFYVDAADAIDEAAADITKIVSEYQR